MYGTLNEPVSIEMPSASSATVTSSYSLEMIPTLVPFFAESTVRLIGLYSLPVPHT